MCQTEAECLLTQSQFQRRSARSRRLRPDSNLAPWSLLIEVGDEKMRCVAELQKQQRKRGNPVILFKIRKDLVLIGAGCVCATPSSLMLSQAKLVPVHPPE